MTRKNPDRDWVVTYEYLYDDVDERHGLRVHVQTTEQFFTGSEAECRRIAAASVAPARHKGKRVLAFRPVIGPLVAWKRHLEELEEMFRDE